jgi:flavin-dependent dehydrogenase
VIVDHPLARLPRQWASSNVFTQVHWRMGRVDPPDPSSAQEVVAVPDRTDASCDVVIAGAGPAGLAVGTFLAREGLRVTCIDPEPFPRVRVGESLDWSSPSLLASIGLHRDDLIVGGVATHKREIRAVTPAGTRMIGRPSPWVHRWPLRFEEVTLHVNRQSFDACLHQKAVEAGVMLVRDRVCDMRFNGDRIIEYDGRSGGRFTGTWFIDATGRRAVIARAAGIARRTWEPQRIALWCQHEADAAFEGTMLYLDDRDEDLTWAWLIPISTGRQSVGVVMSLSRFRALRDEGRSPAEVVADVSTGLPEFGNITPASVRGLRSRTYRPVVSSRVTGVNWLMVGEAAAFSDPITSMGVTAAMRHAAEAAELILRDVRHPGTAGPALAAYDRRVRHVAVLYNLAIESLPYRPVVRSTFVSPVGPGMGRSGPGRVEGGNGLVTAFLALMPGIAPRSHVASVQRRGVGGRAVDDCVRA